MSLPPPPPYQRPIANVPVLLNYASAVVAAILPMTPLLDGVLSEKWYLVIVFGVNIVSALILTKQKSMLNRLSPNAEEPQ